MSVSIYALDKTQFNQGGVPLASGKLFCYAAGTTTKINTYTSSTGATANANPVILDANGQCDLWLTDGVAYKFVLSPSTDTDPPTHAYWTVDNQFNTGGEILSELPNTTSATEGAGMVGYNSSLSYSSGTVGAELNALLTATSARQEVYMCQPAGPGTAWAVFGPTGAPINISSSTTDGLQEAITYACDNGCNLLVQGGGTSRTQDFGLINCTTGITFPPLRAMKIEFQGAHVIFSSAVTGNGVQFDSMQEVLFILNGEIVYQGSASAVMFDPQNAIPVDGTSGCGGSYFILNSIGCTGGSPTACITLNAGTASISSMHFDITELNGSGGVGSSAVCQYGVEMIAGSGTSISANVWDITLIHAVTSSGIQSGIGYANQGSISGNLYRIGSINSDGASASGINTFSVCELYDIGDLSAGANGTSWGVYLQPGANRNRIIAGSISGMSSGPVNDQALLNTLFHDGLNYQGGILTFPVLTRKNTTRSSSGNITWTAAQLVGGIITRGGATTATDTFDTAANIIAALPMATTGFCFDLKVINTDSSGLTINVGAGTTMVGSNTILGGTSHDFVYAVTSPTTMTLYA
jgi:hypothetical protein